MDAAHFSNKVSIMKRLLSIVAVVIATGVMIGVIAMKRTNQNDSCCGSLDNEAPVCSSSRFRLSEDQASNLESSALLDGNATAAGRLRVYHGLYLCNSLLGEVWNYRAAQLGDFRSAYELHWMGLLNDPQRIFSEEALTNSADAAMSDLARRYVQFCYRKCREKGADLSEVACEANDWLLEPAEVRSGDVEVRAGKWKIRYASYRARNRNGNCCETNQVKVAVFPSLPLMDIGIPSDINMPMSGIACQEAVFMAERNGLPWIVVAVDLMSSLMPETLGITEEEKAASAKIALERVFADFSLPSSTVVMPAGNIRFANRFKELIECEYNVQPALETLVVHDEKRKAGQ